MSCSKMNPSPLKIKIMGGYRDVMESETNAFLARKDISINGVEVNDGKVFIFYKENLDESVSEVRCGSCECSGS